jgi:hypothetical protein
LQLLSRITTAMIVSDLFKSAISSVFYDKEIEQYSVTDAVDAEGFKRKRQPSTKTGSFMANVNYSKLDEIKELYGIDESIDMTVTTNDDVAVGSVIKYADVFFEVIRAIPFDSHNLLIAQKCLLK